MNDFKKKMTDAIGAGPKKASWKATQFCNFLLETGPEKVSHYVTRVSFRVLFSGEGQTPIRQQATTFRCDGCGEEFFIGHDPKSVDKRVAEKQAKWLDKVLAD